MSESRLQSIDNSYARFTNVGGDIGSRNVGSVNVSGTGHHVYVNSERPPEPPRVSAPRCPPASANFVGRVQEEERMSKFFFGPGVLFDQLRTFLLIGMGGCGKTQLARKFMTKVYQRFKDRTHLVFYLDATTTQTLQASLIAIAKANGVGKSSEAALGWMSNLDQEIFLYFDNADDPSVNLRDFFPRSDHARILITTRLRDAQRQYGSGRDSAIHLGALSEEEAMDLLRRTAVIDTDLDIQDQAALDLVQELQHLPLAIVQAGAAIFKAQFTFPQYLSQFLRLRTRLMDGEKDRVDGKAMDDYPLHVYTTWKLSYDRLSQPSATLLRLCAHLHHTGITEEMFQFAFQGLQHEDIVTPPVPFIEEGKESKEESARTFLESFSTDDGMWDDMAFRWCIQEACSFSLLSHDTANRTYSVHPLIHDCLQSVALHPQQAAILLAASIHPTWQDQVRLVSLVPHVQKVITAHTTSQLGSRQPTRNTMHPVLAQSFAACFWHARMHRPAESMYQTALQGLAKLDQDSSFILTVQSDFAVLLLDAGNYSAALTIQQSLLAKRLTKLGPEHFDTTVAQANLASTYSSLGRYIEAEGMLRDVVRKHGAALGPVHPRTIMALSKLAFTLHSMGRYTEAENIQRKVLDTRLTIFGAEHSDTVQAQAALAITLHSMGRYTAAEELQQSVLQRRLAVLGPNHPNTITVLANLANTHHAMGRHDEAHSARREVLERCQAVLGAKHPQTIAAQANLGSTLYSLGRYEEAEVIRRDVLAKRLAILGSEHPDTIQALSTLASTLYALGRYAEAEESEREVLGKREMVLGKGHPDTVHALMNLAVSVGKQGRLDEAEVMLRSAVDGFASALGSVLGREHPDTRWARGLLEQCVKEAERRRGVVKAAGAVQIEPSASGSPNQVTLDSPAPATHLGVSSPPSTAPSPSTPESSPSTSTPLPQRPPSPTNQPSRQSIVPASRQSIQASAPRPSIGLGASHIHRLGAACALARPPTSTPLLVHLTQNSPVFNRDVEEIQSGSNALDVD